MKREKKGISESKNALKARKKEKRKREENRIIASIPRP